MGPAAACPGGMEPLLGRLLLPLALPHANLWRLRHPSHPMTTTLAFTATQEALQGALRAASRVVGARPPQPVLEGLLLTAAGSVVSVQGYDLAIGVLATRAAEVETAGAAIVPAGQLSDLVSRLPAGSLVSVTVEPGRLSVAVTGASYTVPLSWEVEDWPALPQLDAERHEIPLTVLQDAIARTAHACAPEGEGKGIAEGLSLVSLPDGSLRLLASDGRRASLVRLPSLGDGIGECVIPSRFARELSRPAADGEAIARVSTDGRMLYCEAAGVSLIGNLLEGDYPPIARVFPDEHQATLTIEASQLADAMDRVAVFSELAVMSIDVDKSALSVAIDCDGGNGVEQLLAEDLHGDDMQIAVNPKFVSSAIKHLHVDMLTIGFNGKTGPVVLEQAGGGLHRYLIMPINTKK